MTSGDDLGRKRILVAFASKHGATADIARSIGADLAAAGHRVDVLPVDAVANPAAFDAIVLGSAVYMGRWMPAARDFVGAYRDTLAARPVWLFSSGPIGDPPKPQEEPRQAAEFARVLGVRDHRVFAGRLDPNPRGLIEKMVTRVAGPGDFRDWEAIRDWAASIAAALDTRIGPGKLSHRAVATA